MIGSCTFTRGSCRAEPRNHAEMRSRRQPRRCSHVRRPPSAHMGARQLILTVVKNPHNSNENQHSSSEGLSLPCAVPASARACTSLSPPTSVGPVEGVPGESAAGGGDTRATRERDTRCRRDRADLMAGTTRLQVMMPDDDSFQSACLRGCWSVRSSAVCRCWAACVRREASCRAWTSGGGCARGVRRRGRAGTVQPASRLASDCLRTADGPGSPLPDVNVVLTPGNP